MINLKTEQNNSERGGVEHKNADAVVSAIILPEASYHEAGTHFIQRCTRKRVSIKANTVKA
jgi:hypothetical protein